jgi:hypothetical protein
MPAVKPIPMAMPMVTLMAIPAPASTMQAY